MPLGPGVRYRWKKFPSGKKVRLAFKNGKVVETAKKPGEGKLTKEGEKMFRFPSSRNKE